MITTFLTVLLCSPQEVDEEETFEFLTWEKGLNAQITFPLPELRTQNGNLKSRQFWEKFIKDNHTTHLLVLLPSGSRIALYKTLPLLLADLCSISVIPSALAAAYGCNQGQLLVVNKQPRSNSISITPIVDYNWTATAHSALVFAQESQEISHLAQVIWQCGHAAGQEHPGRTSILLENICLIGFTGSEKDELRKCLEERLPLSAFSGDLQVKRIGFRECPEYHGVLDSSDLIPFFGGLISARTIFTTDSLYSK